jgi:hypothetical protein
VAAKTTKKEHGRRFIGAVFATRSQRYINVPLSESQIVQKDPFAGDPDEEDFAKPNKSIQTRCKNREVRELQVWCSIERESSIVKLTLATLIG